jgi:hypothetical protein
MDRKTMALFGRIEATPKKKYGKAGLWPCGSGRVLLSTLSYPSPLHSTRIRRIEFSPQPIMNEGMNRAVWLCDLRQGGVGLTDKGREHSKQGGRAVGWPDRRSNLGKSCMCCKEDSLGDEKRRFRCRRPPTARFKENKTGAQKGTEGTYHGHPGSLKESVASESEGGV